MHAQKSSLYYLATMSI